MEQNLGNYLRREREGRSLGLLDLSRTTKIPIRSLERLEAGQYDALPAEVFVRGFIKSYARAVGLNDEDALLLFDAEKQAKQRAESAALEQTLEAQGRVSDAHSRRRVGLAVFVVILLIIATITLSLLLRRPHHIDAGVSSLEPAAEASGRVPV
jgi:cytoskeletal protein RodZ